MRVLHLAYSDGGGGAFKAAYRIHRGLTGVGVDSRMLVSKRVTGDAAVADSGSPAARLWAQLTTHLDVAPWRLLRIPRGESASLAWVGTGAAQRVRALAPEIVQLHWICAGFMRIEELAAIQRPVVWRLADMWPIAGAEHYVGDDVRFREGYRRNNRPHGERGIDLNRWVWARKRRVYARLANLTVVSPSRWLADCARQSVLMKGRRIEVIPTGQDVGVYRPMPKSTAREVLRLPAAGKLIMTGALGLEGDRKGVQLLWRALESLRGRGYRLLVLGARSGAVQPPLETHWLGRLHDDVALALAYSAADVFVAPSMQENLANTVIEAMACGVPCVAFDIGGMPDIIRPDLNGYLARPFEVDDLARGIVAILESGESYARFSAEARRVVEQEFSEGVQARRYAALYDDLLREQQVRTGPLATRQSLD